MHADTFASERRARGAAAPTASEHVSLRTILANPGNAIALFGRAGHREDGPVCCFLSPLSHRPRALRRRFFSPPRARLTGSSPPPAAARRLESLLESYYGMQDEEVAAKDAQDVDSSGFSVPEAATAAVRARTLPDLLAYKSSLGKQTQQLDHEMQNLVYNNYNRFIAATDTIRAMRASVGDMEARMASAGGRAAPRFAPRPRARARAPPASVPHPLSPSPLARRPRWWATCAAWVARRRR